MWNAGGAKQTPAGSSSALAGGRRGEDGGDADSRPPRGGAKPSLAERNRERQQRFRQRQKTRIEELETRCERLGAETRALTAEKEGLAKTVGLLKGIVQVRDLQLVAVTSQLAQIAQGAEAAANAAAKDGMGAPEALVQQQQTMQALEALQALTQLEAHVAQLRAGIPAAQLADAQQVPSGGSDESGEPRLEAPRGGSPASSMRPRPHSPGGLDQLCLAVEMEEEMQRRASPTPPPPVPKQEPSPMLPPQPVLQQAAPQQPPAQQQPLPQPTQQQQQQHQQQMPQAVLPAVPQLVVGHPARLQSPAQEAELQQQLHQHQQQGQPQPQPSQPLQPQPAQPMQPQPAQQLQPQHSQQLPAMQHSLFAHLSPAFAAGAVDAVLVFQGQRVPVHSCMLAAHSGHFARLLAEAQHSQPLFPGARELLALDAGAPGKRMQDLMLFLRHCYGSLNMNPVPDADVLRLAVLANEFASPALLRRCDATIASRARGRGFEFFTGLASGGDLVDWIRLADRLGLGQVAGACEAHLARALKEGQWRNSARLNELGQECLLRVINRLAEL